MKRIWEIDAARGLMIVLMTITHVPTRLTDPVGQPFGFVSAAEGFVLLSAFVAGLVYSRIGHTRGLVAMRQAFWQRAWKIYCIQALLLLFLFTIIVHLGLQVDHPEIRDMMRYYLVHPHNALAYGLLLLYRPAFLDILPMYILFMMLSPWVMGFGMRHGWRWPLALSGALWLAAQCGATRWVYAWATTHLQVPVPFDETGSFDTLAWQFLWMVGLWLGAGRSVPDAPALRIPRGLLFTAVPLALAFFCWRHLGPGGQAPFGPAAPELTAMLFDKWRLAPLRLLDMAALCVVAVRFGPPLLHRLPRPRWLEDLGSAALPVFCTHLVVVFLVLTFLGRDNPAMPWWGDVLLLGEVFCGMHLVARWVLAREAGARARRPARAPEPAAQAGPALPAIHPAEPLSR